MSALELNLLVGDAVACLGYAALGLCKLAFIAAALASPFVLEWVADGCPSAAEQVETLKEEVRYGWR